MKIFNARIRKIQVGIGSKKKRPFEESGSIKADFEATDVSLA